MAEQKVIILGDDLFSNEPFCKELLCKGFHFILVCKPDSHKTLYEYLSGNDSIKTITIRRWNGKFHELISFRYCNNLPIKDGENVLPAILKTGINDILKLGVVFDGKRVWSKQG